MARVEHDLTDEQWTALKVAWGGCAYCGAAAAALQRDCVLPVSRGGRYTLENVVPACASCNASKCNAEVGGWLRRKRLDERAFLLRFAEIVRSLTALADQADPAGNAVIDSPRVGSNPAVDGVGVLPDEDAPLTVSDGVDSVVHDPTSDFP